ncbi:DNA mismatch repair endonuclease MutL [Methanoplanus sp. FWC-SCC4]|uniref:DNA mismatch repair protein MutL n=1 Tax=Methanochimaera problematica TaxID=2609417 RepID=A0AA97I3C6_9EURY|nr:DNA mismatch repair endonuclease MutL [Methanoplanus sp. FWC-SCC4]WOF15746.1 DNA mismatch repair endonuclease MutL [Methanoplanus sp. FWC-SCC4]
MKEIKQAKTIHVLDEATINKIAAGEVIERPASVVKELVENSIDAGAKSVKVDIGSDSKGIFRIRVVDDGTGMDRDSAVLSFTRHATSKLSDISDLLKLHTMGFRGEALASIAGVSKVTMITKMQTIDVSPGTKIVIEGGDVLDVSDIGAPDGTSILIENLFFNTPARKKFLKSRQTEFSHVHKAVQNLALANPGISFQLNHNGKEKLATIRTSNLKETVAYIYGGEIADQLLEVKGMTPYMKVEGLCAVPSKNLPNSRDIIISINNRSVNSVSLSRAIKRGYGTLLPKDRYPVAFLNIILDKKIVDVNVHPTKREVRLSREKEIEGEISALVKKTLESGDLLSSKNPVAAESFSYQKSLSFSDDKPLFSVESKTKEYKVNNEVLNLDFQKDEKSYHPRFSATDTQLRLTENFDEENFGEYKIPPMKPLGQVDASYILARRQTCDGEELVIVDQHAAHERILYDQVLKIRETGKNSQELLVPVVLTLRTDEAAVLVSNIDSIIEEGFFIEEFGKNTFAVRAVPLILGKRVGTEIIKDIVADLMEDNRKSIEYKKEKISSTIACRAAIKAGAVLTYEQMERLLDQLSRTETPYTCPHGRPTMINFSKSKLDSLFKRT